MTGPRRSRRGRRPVEPRFDCLQPGPVAFRHHHPSGVVERINLDRDRSWSVGLSKMGSEQLGRARW